MKSCPVCQERYEDEMNFCTFDGTVLSPVGATQQPSSRPHSFNARAATSVQTYESSYSYRAAPRANGWMIAFFVMLVVILIGGASAVYFFLTDDKPARTVISTPAATEEKPQEAIKPDKPAEAILSLSELRRDELLSVLPKNLLRRFHAGEPSQGKPDDFRVVKDDKGEYVVLLGSGKIERQAPLPAERILILKFEENQFRDATRQALPPAYGAGVITGPQAQVRFDQATTNIIIREPASSNSVINECATCEHAYQQVTFEWKGGHYVEADRSWENDRYTAFYVVADALEKRKVDARARSIIDKALDATISQGFARSGKEGWTVEFRSNKDESATGTYEINNGTEILVITVSKIKGQWKAVQITDSL